MKEEIYLSKKWILFLLYTFYKNCSVNISAVYGLSCSLKNYFFKSYKYQIGQLNLKVKRGGYSKDMFDYAEKLCKKKA